MRLCLSQTRIHLRLLRKDPSEPVMAVPVISGAQPRKAGGYPSSMRGLQLRSVEKAPVAAPKRRSQTGRRKNGPKGRGPTESCETCDRRRESPRVPENRETPLRPPKPPRVTFWSV